ncbi:hypothetical protein OC846_002369 [Tilletia horrida]|uniref:Uncharacterized protein n=1 Tax=Tilletia horrida TaxID=155126 RepID=A0AAN6GRD2_9BASI|nr:hypothetical protein OC845_002499 [Tilletia horrida]KAK0553838.1 hypothetical protein OC846_002369 [Tilletia horrida]KAK0567801.1 hypothetical protein OC861_002544 [Tilletia horrida]
MSSDSTYRPTTVLRLAPDTSSSQQLSKPSPSRYRRSQPEAQSQEQQQIIALHDQNIKLQTELIQCLKEQARHASAVAAAQFWKHLALTPQHEHIYYGAPTSAGFLSYVKTVFSVNPEIFASDEDRCAFVFSRFSKDQAACFQDLVSKGQAKGDWAGLQEYMRHHA